MKKIYLKILILSFLITFPTACKSFMMLNTPAWREDNSGNIIYERLGIQFPPEFQDLHYVGTTVYDDKGQDVSIGYNGRKDPYIFTFYIYLRSIYPQKDLKSHFEAVVGDVFSQYQDTELVGAHFLSFPFDEIRVEGMIAFLKYSNPFLGPDKMGGIAALVPYGEYYIYMRMTYPFEDDRTYKKSSDAAFTLMLDFAESLNIPAPVDKSQI